MLERKDINYRIFCYLNDRRLAKTDQSVFTIKTLEQYCNVPVYTIQHLLRQERLMTEEKAELVSVVLQKEFGFNPTNNFTNTELEEREFYDIFN